MVISARARTVLGQVVNLHYRTCEPVGSSLISRTKALSVSPATIRNIMVRLEREGYLTQPHTSAGRLPTDQGYRTYVESISLTGQDLEQSERDSLTHLLQATNEKGPGILKVLADYIHRRTQLLTFHLPFKHSGLRLKHVHFERLNSDQLLVLWVAQGGQTFQMVIPAFPDVQGTSILQKTENFFNSCFQNCNLIHIQQKLAVHTGHGNGEWDFMIKSVHAIVSSLTDQAFQVEKLEFQGTAGVLQMPEFQSVERLRCLFHITGDESKLRPIVQRGIAHKDQWLLFFIGGEMHEPELHPFSLILAKYHNREDGLGCVGVVGPKRLPYLRALQMLSFARDHISAQAS